MKISLFLVLISAFVTSELFAKNIPAYRLFSDVSVFRQHYDVRDPKENIFGLKSPFPDFGHEFDYAEGSRNFRVSNGTCRQLPAAIPSRNFYTRDFRTLTFGLSRTLAENSLHLISHAFGINYSASNSRLGIIYSDDFVVGDDNASYSSIYDSSFTLDFYEQSHRTGLLYNLEMAFKIGRHFHFSVGLRNTLNFNISDKLFYRYKYRKYGHYTMFDDVSDVSKFPDTWLYINEKPDKESYQYIERKMAPQFDCTLFVKPEFYFGKKKDLGFYFQYGIALKTLYGQAYKSKSYRPFYGTGLSIAI